jgi:hypothetical protein
MLLSELTRFLVRSSIIITVVGKPLRGFQWSDDTSSTTRHLHHLEAFASLTYLLDHSLPLSPP